MVAFIDPQRDTHGVESICRLVPIAPSTYFRHKAAQADPAKRSARTIRDEVLKAIILRLWHEHQRVYGAHKVLRYAGRLADAGIEPSVGSRGDSYVNAVAELVIGLFKTEVIQRQRPWRTRKAVEFATLAWVDT